MYAHLEKPKENKSRAVANSVAQKRSNVMQGFGFVDNRTQHAEKMKLDDTELDGSNYIVGTNTTQHSTTCQYHPSILRNLGQNTHPVQRRISKYTTKKKHEDATEGQLNQLVIEYINMKGEGKKAEIEGVIEELQAAKGWYSLNDVRSKLQLIEADNVIFENKFPENINKPTLPVGDSGKNKDITKRRQAIKSYSFTSVTTLVAQVLLTDNSSFKVELRNESDTTKIKGNRENRGHAEMLLLRQIDNTLIKSKAELAQITITINNSPCEECTDDIIEWAKKYENVEMTIHYVNPYESNPDTLDKLAEAGISTYPFSVLGDVGSDTDEELSIANDKGISAKMKFKKYALKAQNMEKRRKKITIKTANLNNKQNNFNQGEFDENQGENILQDWPEQAADQVLLERVNNADDLKLAAQQIAERIETAITIDQNLEEVTSDFISETVAAYAGIIRLNSKLTDILDFLVADLVYGEDSTEAWDDLRDDPRYNQYISDLRK